MSRPRPLRRSLSVRFAAVLPVVLLAVAALAGCATGPTDGAAASSATTVTRAEPGAYPVTIRHAFGSTTIEKEPTRVATVGWTDQDNALALGVVPVGATKITFGGNRRGSTDWFDAALAKTGGTQPVRYDDTDGIPVDEIAQTRPDLILATNSGLTRKDYDRLSKIAPVVAYPTAPYTTPWQVSLRTVGKALGRSDRAATLEKQTEARIAAASRRYPALTGASLIYGYLSTTDLSTIGVYSPQDPRVAFLHDLGLTDAPAVASAIKPGEFYGTVSAERAPRLTSDVFVTWAENARDEQTFRSNPLIGQIPALKSGHAYVETDQALTEAQTNPTPLSIPVILETFVPRLAAAVQGS